MSIDAINNGLIAFSSAVQHKATSQSNVAELASTFDEMFTKLFFQNINIMQADSHDKDTGGLEVWQSMFTSNFAQLAGDQGLGLGRLLLESSGYTSGEKQ